MEKFNEFSFLPSRLIFQQADIPSNAQEIVGKKKSPEKKPEGPEKKPEGKEAVKKSFKAARKEVMPVPQNVLKSLKDAGKNTLASVKDFIEKVVAKAKTISDEQMRKEIDDYAYLCGMTSSKPLDFEQRATILEGGYSKLPEKAAPAPKNVAEYLKDLWKEGGEKALPQFKQMLAFINQEMKYEREVSEEVYSDAKLERAYGIRKKYEQDRDVAKGALKTIDGKVSELINQGKANQGPFDQLLAEKRNLEQKFQIAQGRISKIDAEIAKFKGRSFTPKEEVFTPAEEGISMPPEAPKPLTPAEMLGEGLRPILGEKIREGVAYLNKLRKLQEAKNKPRPLSEKDFVRYNMVMEKDAEIYSDKKTEKKSGLIFANEPLKVIETKDGVAFIQYAHFNEKKGKTTFRTGYMKAENLPNKTIAITDKDVKQIKENVRVEIKGYIENYTDLLKKDTAAVEGKAQFDTNKDKTKRIDTPEVRAYLDLQKKFLNEIRESSRVGRMFYGKSGGELWNEVIKGARKARATEAKDFVKDLKPLPKKPSDYMKQDPTNKDLYKISFGGDKQAELKTKLIDMFPNAHTLEVATKDGQKFLAIKNDAGNDFVHYDIKNHKVKHAPVYEGYTVKVIKLQ